MFNLGLISVSSLESRISDGLLKIPAPHLRVGGPNIPQGLRGSAADYQAIWETSAGGVAHLQEPASKSTFGSSPPGLGLTLMLCLSSQDSSFKLLKMATAPCLVLSRPAPWLEVTTIANSRET